MQHARNVWHKIVFFPKVYLRPKTCEGKINFYKFGDYSDTAGDSVSIT
jgi:hypothetical protein